MINHEFGNGKHIPPILIYLVGGDWNHGMDYDFPETVGNGKSFQLTNSMIFQRGRYTTNQAKNREE